MNKEPVWHSLSLSMIHSLTSQRFRNLDRVDGRITLLNLVLPQRLCTPPCIFKRPCRIRDSRDVIIQNWFELNQAGTIVAGPQAQSAWPSALSPAAAVEKSQIRIRLSTHTDSSAPRQNRALVTCAINGHFDDIPCLSLY